MRIDPVEVFRRASDPANIEQRSFMVESDLCGSTAITWSNWRTGLGLQALHEAVCLNASGLTPDSPSFKALGDGVMMEFDDPVKACRVALDLIDESRKLRVQAGQGRGLSEFKEFFLKVVVVGGAYNSADNTQRWLGLLPTKAARYSVYAQPDQVWIDNSVREAIHPQLGDLSCQCGDKPENGDAFAVFLKGLRDGNFTIHNLRRKNTPSPLTDDERAKPGKVTWDNVMEGAKHIVAEIERSKFSPSVVVGIGRSGAILAGVIAGNLPSRNQWGHVKIALVERFHEDENVMLSTITERGEAYRKGLFVGEGDPHAATDGGPYLLAMGEAKTNNSFKSARTWLERRGIKEIKTAALIKGFECRMPPPDFFWQELDAALMPWQFAKGYDQDWHYFRKER
jgi:hypothetical protein